MIQKYEKLILAPAKINLHLSIGEKRKDGFHDIQSIFAPISLYDELNCKVSKAREFSVVINTSKKTNPAGCGFENYFNMPVEKNLIYKAAKLFFEKTALPFSLNTKIKKNIPSGAGLGGGSSDAAAILKFLNEAFNSALSQDELFNAASDLGSDVPFFLEKKAAYIEGRGEKIEYIPVKLNYKIALIKPSFDSGTAEAYRLLDEKRQKFFSIKKKRAAKAELLAALSLPPEKWNFHNDFEDVFFDAAYPYAAEYKNAVAALKKEGAAFVSLSGSGSAVFGVLSAQKNVEKQYQQNIYMLLPSA